MWFGTDFSWLPLCPLASYRNKFGHNADPDLLGCAGTDGNANRRVNLLKHEVE
jgi:hypothetical protein